MKIVLELQYEYHRRRSLYRDLSSFPVKGIDVPVTNLDTIFTAIFQINRATTDFKYKFLEKSCNDLNLGFSFCSTVLPIYTIHDDGENILNLSNDEISFIQSVIQADSSNFPSLISTDKKWLKQAYSLWKLDKNLEITQSDLEIPCDNNLCNLVKIILSMEYIKKKCT